MNARDVRGCIEEADRLGELKKIDGAAWDIELGTITELGHHRGEGSRALLFDLVFVNQRQDESGHYRGKERRVRCEQVRRKHIA